MRCELLLEACPVCVPQEESSVQVSRVERPFGALSLSLETGKLAKQAHGAVVARYGEWFDRQFAGAAVTPAAR